MEMTNSKFKFAVNDFDLERFLGDSGFRFMHTGGGQIMLSCPFCGASNKFYIGAENKLWICFKCEERGNLVKLVAEVSGVDVKTAIGKVYGKRDPGWIYTKGSEILNYRIHRPIEDESWMAEPDYDFAPKIENVPSGSSVHSYLDSRGIDAEMIKKFELRFTSAYWRLVLPIFTESGIGCGWVARDITGTHPMKYMNSTGLKKSRLLYGANLHWDRESMVLVEGPIDAIKCHTVGGVALLGKSVSVEQRNILLSLPNLKTLYVGIDPDQPVCAREIAAALSPFFGVYLINFDSYGDLGGRKVTEIEGMVARASLYTGEKQFPIDFKSL